MIDNKTTNLKLPLPDLGNYTAEDIPRLIQALKLIDELLATKTDMNTKADATETASAINLKANTEDVINALALKALTGGSASNAFLVGAATNDNHAVRLLQMQQRVGSVGAPSWRNKIVDGRFDFWYEGISQSSSGYGSDTMSINQNIGSSKVHSRQLLTPGVDLPAINVPSARHYSRTVVTSVAGASNNVVKFFRIEGVGTLAGRTCTFSFYARSDAARSVGITYNQYFGSNGSPTVVTSGQQIQLTTSFARYSTQVTLPSIAGKSISGGNDYLMVGLGFDVGSSLSSQFGGLGQQSGTFDVACVQFEEGEVASPFDDVPAALSLQRVNRYYETSLPNPINPTSTGAIAVRQSASGSTALYCSVRFNALKRASPAITYYNSETPLVPGTITSVGNGNVTATALGTSERGVTQITLGTPSESLGQAYWVHFVADARL